MKIKPKLIIGVLSLAALTYMLVSYVLPALFPMPGTTGTGTGLLGNMLGGTMAKPAGTGGRPTSRPIYGNPKVPTAAENQSAITGGSFAGAAANRDEAQVTQQHVSQTFVHTPTGNTEEVVSNIGGTSLSGSASNR